jgi:hypothetical protein
MVHTFNMESPDVFSLKKNIILFYIKFSSYSQTTFPFRRLCTLYNHQIAANTHKKKHFYYVMKKSINDIKLVK